MIIKCESCLRKFIVKDKDIPKKGRMVQCGYCSTKWYQMPFYVKTETTEIKIDKTSKKINEDLSVEKMKASDGKTYRFLGRQWAELLPSGKTGLFAKKQIGKELNKLTGREERNFATKKKSKKELDPSEGLSNEINSPTIYKQKKTFGFFSFFFLLIIIGFSLVGVLKFFENDLLILLPESEYVFILLDEQLTFFAETVKNIIIIIQDLIKDY